jgi:hypothetical protein
LPEAAAARRDKIAQPDGGLDLALERGTVSLSPGISTGNLLSGKLKNFQWPSARER